MHAIKRLRISALNFISIYLSQGLVITKVFLAEKMSVSRICSLLFMSVILCGCLYGQCMDGPCSLERARIIESIKAYGEYWVKPDMTVFDRSQDSISCGGSYRGPDFSFQQLSKVSQKEDKDEFSARTRLTKIWIECMQSKGYEFTR